MCKLGPVKESLIKMVLDQTPVSHRFTLKRTATTNRTRTDQKGKNNLQVPAQVQLEGNLSGSNSVSPQHPSGAEMSPLRHLGSGMADLWGRSGHECRKPCVGGRQPPTLEDQLFGNHNQQASVMLSR